MSVHPAQMKCGLMFSTGSEFLNEAGRLVTVSLWNTEFVFQPAYVDVVYASGYYS